VYVCVCIYALNIKYKYGSGKGGSLCKEAAPAAVRGDFASVIDRNVEKLHYGY